MRIHYADPEPCRIRGAEFLPTGELVVCDQANRSLKLWSTTFQYLAHYILPGTLTEYKQRIRTYPISYKMDRSLNRPDGLQSGIKLSSFKIS